MDGQQRSWVRLGLLITALLLMTQCAVPEPPRCYRVPWKNDRNLAQKLAEARHQWLILKDGTRASEWPAATKRYNQAVDHLLDQLRCQSGAWEDRAARIGTALSPRTRLDAHLDGLYGIYPADDIGTGMVRHRHVVSGVGVPVVGWKKTSRVGVPRGNYLLPNGLPYNLTAYLAFDDQGRAEWHFHKRWYAEEVQIGVQRHVLAADWTAANAFFWRMCELDDLTIQNVLLPERFMSETGVYFLTPYDPSKIPVVFFHGLVSSPATFKNVVNDLIAQRWFRERYQIWLYNYPTGNPWLFSGMKFREKMREVNAYARSKGDDRYLNQMVIVGHSMGGLLARSSVTEPKHQFYREYFNRPIHLAELNPKVRDLVKETMLYRPLREPKRVVFMAVPHRGSPLANRSLAVWISKLIRLPKTLTVELVDLTVQTVGEAWDGQLMVESVPNSINSLSPMNRSNRVLGQMPLPKRVIFHSIIGDRGKNNTPLSSDGVVPYWSSHVDSVASEAIVPSNHSVPDDEAAARELQRILQIHLKNLR